MLFLQNEGVDFASYADDNTPYFCGCDINTVISKLERSAAKLFKWFSENYLKANAEKCHLLLSKKESSVIKIGEVQIVNSRQVKLLGINIDSNLT